MAATPGADKEFLLKEYESCVRSAYLEADIIWNTVREVFAILGPGLLALGSVTLFLGATWQTLTIVAFGAFIATALAWFTQGEARRHMFVRLVDFARARQIERACGGAVHAALLALDDGKFGGLNKEATELYVTFKYHRHRRARGLRILLFIVWIIAAAYWFLVAIEASRMALLS